MSGESAIGAHTSEGESGVSRESGEGPEGPGPTPLGPSGVDEDSLRDLLHHAVQGIEPSDQALDRLQRAVPARRTRKRQAVVGVAAAAILIGTAVPALVHVTAEPSGGHDHPAIAGDTERTEIGAGLEDDRHGRAPGGHSPSDKSPGHTKGGREDSEETKGAKDKDTTEPADGAEPTGSTAASGPPECDPGQLGAPKATTSQPDKDGKVYGTFKIANVSGKKCVIEGEGSVAAAALGAADPAKIAVVEHMPGDAATKLPPPSRAERALMLEPGTSYEVRFAWVPSADCHTDDHPGEGTGSVSPDPSPSGDTEIDRSASPDVKSGTNDVSPQLLREADGDEDGSVSISHTAERGGPTADTTIPDACAGTIYRTGVLQPQ
ncbi:hypothetical protein [Streptomyces tsukubensis]|uniref:DUF4232 domain-containing protein n=1 Tax=Streptomyces tsukubensis TaxID=83656 RepID=A0A1V4ABH3_9ACTN|nr:hypothetical protein [Streptomyces tsukubensis]OON81004.1 hypothetical protein B1H18_09245 [Streptomyces tsukubensis]QFR94841.1 hypothetical protein GBW32_19620 [Streptomyces tsukubensis]